jgi:hypothetical protein
MQCEVLLLFVAIAAAVVVALVCVVYCNIFIYFAFFIWGFLCILLLFSWDLVSSLLDGELIFPSRVQ